MTFWLSICHFEFVQWLKVFKKLLFWFKNSPILSKTAQNDHMNKNTCLLVFQRKIFSWIRNQNHPEMTNFNLASSVKNVFFLGFSQGLWPIIYGFEMLISTISLTAKVSYFVDPPLYRCCSQKTLVTTLTYFNCSGVCITHCYRQTSNIL